jgi:serine/threonine protein kinase
MGEVYRALDTRLHRTAIKILLHDKLADANRKRRFLQEARAASALTQPNIVVLHDISSLDRRPPCGVRRIERSGGLRRVCSRWWWRQARRRSFRGLRSGVRRIRKPTNCISRGSDIQEFTELGFKKSVVDFKNAIQRDPEYAAAYAGLADAYSYQASFELERPKDILPLAESNAAKAIEKDPQTAEAYTALGMVALAYYWGL